MVKLCFRNVSSASQECRKCVSRECELCVSRVQKVSFRSVWAIWGVKELFRDRGSFFRGASSDSGVSALFLECRSHLRSAEAISGGQRCWLLVGLGMEGQDPVLSEADSVAPPSAAEWGEMMKDSGPGTCSSVIDYATDVQASCPEPDRPRGSRG